MSSDAIMCPSNQCKPGSKLLGIRQNNGIIAILPDPLPIDEHFIETTREHEVPVLQRFRFTNKCIEAGCAQWNGQGCNVIENVMQHMDSIPTTASELPACGIRSRCRWYLQKQTDACKICPYILYEITEDDVLEMQKNEV